MANMNDTLISVVIPVFNEAEVLEQLLGRLRPALVSACREFEIIFVDDGSDDGSLEMVTALSRADCRIKVVSFCRNFGHQAAITAGLDFARGGAVIMMDADLQDPPEVIPKMVALYHEGYDVVSAQRVSREGDGWFKRLTAEGFYWIMRRMVDKHLQRQVGDFRLVSRSALIALRSLREEHRFMRGLIAWLGLKEAIVPFHREPRAAGVTKYPLLKMVRFSWTAITSFSALPLRFSTFLGTICGLVSFGYFVYAIWAALILKITIPGWASLVAIQTLFFGLIFLFFGLLGDYVARIYEEAKSRPLYIVNRTCNLPAAQQALRAVILHEEPAEHPKFDSVRDGGPSLVGSVSVWPNRRHELEENI